jgi:hypothetical protein
MRRTNRIGSTLWRSLLIGAVAATGIFVSGPPPSDVADARAPRVDGPVSDKGLEQAHRLEMPKLVSRRTEVLQAGVVGINKQNDTFFQTDISVAAIAEVGDTIYVGGKFTRVEIAATGQRKDQRFLAAFDRATGAWIHTFRPNINGNVWDLKATDDGRLIVAGQFTSVNGEPHTTGVAMLDAATGAVDPNWRVDLTLTGSDRWPLARTLDIDDGKVYIGGNFTRIAGTNGVITKAGQMARVDLDTGNVDRSFLPHFDGIVFDIDADADRVYAVGDFLYVNGVWSIGLAVLRAGNGNLVTGLKPWVRTSIESTNHSYQQAVLALDDQIWQAGAQHSRQVYRPHDYALMRSWVSAPWGDGQALATLNGIVYSGSHANETTRLYQDAYRSFPLVGATSNKPVRWMAAFSTLAPEHLAWYPDIGSKHGEGSWELFVDSTDCLWTGGDFNRGSYDGGTPRYVQGFAKFC